MPISTLYRTLAADMPREQRRQMAIVGTLISIISSLATWGATTAARQPGPSSIDSRVSIIETRTEENSRRLDALEQRSQAIQTYLQEILTRTARIEGKLEDRRGR